MKNFKRSFQFALGACSLLIIGCNGSEEFVSLDNLASQISTTPAPVDPPDDDPPISCDPFGSGNNEGSANTGLKGQLFSLKSDFVIYPAVYHLTVNDFKNELLVNRAEVNIFVPNLNVTPRAFDAGFPIGINDQGEAIYVEDPQTGEPTLEWFSLQFKGHLQAPSDIEAGQYEFALVSDDGATFSLDGETIISNPDIHPPTLNCAAAPIELRAGEGRDITIDYFQGPRYHIALVLLFRKVSDQNPLQASALCGKQWIKKREWESEGWQAVPEEFFSLGSEKNPCHNKK